MFVTDETFRTQILMQCGATTPAIVAELLAYNTKPFPPETAAARPLFPLPDEAHVDAWRGYAREAETSDVFTALRRHFIQLRFPIRAGISEEDGYKQATRRGIL